LNAALGGPNDISIGMVLPKIYPSSSSSSLSLLTSLAPFRCIVCPPLLYSSTHIGGGGTALRSPVYNLLPVDLRTPPAASLAPLLASSSGRDDGPLLSPSLPTLLLFECVLAYMTPDASNALIRWFVDHFAAAGATAGPLGGVVYEMFKLNDAFGRVMLNNLKVRARTLTLTSDSFADIVLIDRPVLRTLQQSRGVSLPGAEPHTDITSLSRRFLDLGFTTAQALTLREMRRTYVEPRELQRIAQLEMLDEVEELELVLDHYAISWGVRFPDENWAHEGGNTWKLARKDQVENENDDS